MSGDVQPRKRKDKKRKREDESVPVTFHPKDPTEDVNIHVHKEEGTGGGICAKVVFFILFSALIVLIGLIITEHRGLTDLDVAESESRYSQLFEGWIDNEKHDDHHTLDDHDNEHFDDEEQDHDDGHTLDDHDNEHIDDEPSEEQEHTLDDHDNEQFDEDDQSIPRSEENEDDEEVPEESQEEDKSEIKSGRYRREISGEDDEDDNERESQQDLDETEEEEVLADSETKEDEDETPDSEDREDDGDDEENTDSQQYLEDTVEEEEELDETVANSDINEDTEEIEDDSENEDRTFSEEDEVKNNPSSEDEIDSTKESQEDKENQSTEDEENEQISEEEKVQKRTSDNIVDSNEIEEFMEPRDESNEEDETENVVNEEIEPTEKEEPSEVAPENSEGSAIPGSLSMIVKAIIGAAILAVGHFVLVKKWKSDSSDEDNKENLERDELHLDLSRRNTIIPPPTLQEIEQDVDYANEEYSDEEETASNEGFRVVPEDIKKRYEQLRSSYSRSISPESDTGEENIKTGSDDEIEIENIEEEELEEEEIQEEEVEEEDDYEEEEYEEEDDDELMKKLEAKYGKLKLEPKGRTPSPDQEESDSEKLSDDNNDYEYSSITNEDDWQIHEDLDEAQRKLSDNAAKALKMFEKILEKYPSSPRGIYGLAQALDALAEMKKSNEFLEESVANYLKIADLKIVPDELYKAAMERCIDRLRFRGKYGKAVTVHLKLIERYPYEPNYRNQLVITYLTIGRVEQARLVLEETLHKWPDDGCALVHYGFIWKTADQNLKKGVYYMQKGIQSQDPCVIDGRFYFHLGDALFRLGSKDKALKLYEDGVKHKLFLSKYQRSLYNVPRLTARPWWEKDQLLSYHLLLKDLVKNWQVIRNEGMSVLNENAYFQDESENLRDTGNWKQFELFARGRKNTKNCNKTPFTCRIIESHPNASGCRRGQTKFSVMHPGTHVWAHCGPTNCRLRVHLGLKVPALTFIRVGDEIRSWEDGKLFIFDDSFEHEVWHNGTDTRLVLIVDVWHPELSMKERETLSSL